jgi:hypothetical protein
MSVLISVYIQPNSSKNEICGEHDGMLKVKIASPAVDGKANKELVKFMAEYLGIKKKDISIKSGETSRRKVLELHIDKNTLIINTLR